MGVETRWVTPGADAFAALADLVVAAKDGDPLRPVTVVTPTPAAAVALRRGLARALGGIALVGFHALDALAELIGARRIGALGIEVAVDRELVVAAVRAALGREPGTLGPIAHHRSTWEAAAATIDELAGLDPAGRAEVAASGGLPAEMVRLHDAVASSVGVGGRTAVLRAATDELVADPASAAELGEVIVHLPGRLDRLAVDFVRALASGTTVTVVAGRCGIGSVDTVTIDLVEQLGGVAPSGPPPSPPAPTRTITANDVDDEVRVAVRALLEHARAGVPMHRMALVHPSGAPYARTVAELLRAAEVPYSGPSTETLAQTAAGRVLTGLLEVAESGYSRQSVIDLWASGAVVDPEGRPIRSVQLDHRTRELGIVGGLGSWRRRLADREAWLAAHAPDDTDDQDADRLVRRRAAHAAELDDLRRIGDALTTIADLLDRRPTRWSAVAGWGDEVLDGLCGPHTRRRSWPDHELDADTAIRTVLGRLAALERVEPAPVSSVVAETIRTALDAPAPRRSGTGSGLLVTTLDRPAAVPLDVVAVVGMAEGHVPRPARDDVLLGDALRQRVGLPLADDSTVDQHRALLTVLGTAGTERILTAARRDQRSGRTQVPSRWFVDAVEQMTGTRPRTEALIEGHEVDGVEVVASHGHGLRALADDDRGALHRHERALASLSVAADFDRHPVAVDELVAAGATLARNRSADAYTRFDGNLGGDGVDVVGPDVRHLSPTSIETYASCPRRWFFSRVLGLGEIDRPEEIDRLQAHDKGSLAHRILERFVDDAIRAGTVPAPDEPWGAEGAERLLAIAEEEFADFERRGLTGHPRWWAHDRAEIVSVLTETLGHDDALRAEHRATPRAVELSFGRDGHAPLEVTLDDGRVVRLAGQADRVDEIPGGLMVHDYKYASSSPYDQLRKPLDAGGDPLDGGRRIQLVAYAEAAAQQGGVDRSSAWYWFLRPGHTGRHIGYEIAQEHRQMFRRVLAVVVDGIAAGNFPARSGSYDWFWGTHASCTFCEFDDICPNDREEEWERVRADPAVADLVTLVEEGAPAFLEPASDEAEVS